MGKDLLMRKLLATMLALALVPTSAALGSEASEYARQAHITRQRAASDLLAQARHPNPVAEYGRNVWFDSANGKFRTRHRPAHRRVVRAVATDLGGGSPIEGPINQSFIGAVPCTLGFYARLGSSFYMTTAGHCLQSSAPGGIWLSGSCKSSTTNGVVELAADVGYVSFAQIGCDSANVQHTWGNPWEREKPYHYPEWKPFQINPYTGASEPVVEIGPETESIVHEDPLPYVGEFVCKYGASVSHSCGVVEATNLTSEIEYRQERRKVAHTFAVCTTARPGDSGGPIEQRLMETWGKWEARGVGYTIAAETNSTCNTIGDELAPALAREGLELP
jgi:hypothetical protein